MERRLDMLLVDDEPDDAALFGNAVRKTGLDICLKTLTSGSQAIQYLEAKGDYADRAQHPLPDVIVLDLKMPGLNGFDFLAWRKASGLFAAIPVVVFSGLSAEAEVKRVFELGANRHIVKPATLEDWERVVGEIYSFTTDYS